MGVQPHSRAIGLRQVTTTPGPSGEGSSAQRRSPFRLSNDSTKRLGWLAPDWCPWRGCSSNVRGGTVALERVWQQHRRLSRTRRPATTSAWPSKAPNASTPTNMLPSPSGVWVAGEARDDGAQWNPHQIPKRILEPRPAALDRRRRGLPVARACRVRPAPARGRCGPEVRASDVHTAIGAIKQRARRTLA